MLTMFTIIGITFVYMSDSYALSARIGRDGENVLRPGLDPQQAFAFVMGQLIYDVNDDPNGVNSSLRGHSLARTMYGWNHDLTQPTVYLSNEVPYSGVGRLRLQTVDANGNALNWGTNPVTNQPYTEQDLLNYKYFAQDTLTRDPERLGPRANPSAVRGPYACAAVPYTYADNNNVFLAVLDPNTGQVVVPSFHRPWLFGPLASTNPNWTTANPVGKYLTLRPRPADNQPTFPFPADAFGDVKNLEGAPGGNDSIWLDPGGPVMTAANGQSYKMLVAPLIIELDSRINLNVHGNILGANNTHAGNQGWGPWEVNLGLLFNGNTEWVNLFLGNPATAVPNSPPLVLGRYGNGGLPIPPPLPPGSPPPGSLVTMPRGMAPVDLNAIVDPNPNPPPAYGTLSTPYYLPGLPAGMNPFDSVGLSPFAVFPATCYGNGAPRETSNPAGVFNHPLGFNPINPAPGNRLLPLRDTAAMLQYSGTNAQFLSCNTTRLCPTAFSTAAGAAVLRQLTTHASFDLDRAAVVPYIWDYTAQPYVLSVSANTGMPKVSQTTLPYDSPGSPFYAQTQTPTPKQLIQTTATLPANSEFQPRPPNQQEGTPQAATTFRSILSQATKLNLSTPLPAYPTPNAQGVINTTQASNVQQVNQAVQARQLLAQNLFQLLQQSTGALPPASVNPQTQSGQWAALRYLAQVAVNIVDQIDQDSYNTPFQWWPGGTAGGVMNTPAEWVCGVETPRLVINEVYSQFDNDPGDNKIFSSPGVLQMMPMAGYYYSNLWIELQNPLNGALEPTPVVPDLTAQLSSYQVVIANNSVAGTAQGQWNVPIMQDPANVLGDPNFTPPGNPVPNNIVSTLNDIPAGATVPPAGINYPSITPPIAATVTNGSQGFYVLGPAGNHVLPAANPNLPASAQSAGLAIQVPLTGVLPGGKPPQYTVLLRRLLCPALPLNDPNNPAQPYNAALPYNPYITVDYVGSTQPNDARAYNPAPLASPPAVTTFASTGRQQPWAASTATTKQVFQPAPNQPSNTFFQPNGPTGTQPATAAAALPTLTVPFNWMVQLDRQFVSKAELMHTSYCKPHELTQLFVQSVPMKGNQPYQHLVPWGDSNSRLYRFLELVDVPCQISGVGMGDRTPGRLNLNGVLPVPINGNLKAITIEALLDAQAANQYTTQTHVDPFAASLLNARTPGYNQNPQGPPVLSGNDTPYWGLGLGAASTPTQTTLWVHQPAPGPVLSSLLPTSSIATLDPYSQSDFLNKLFNNSTTRSNVFAVWVTVGFFAVNAQGQLGAEIALSEGQQVRHRMFAIVDRTGLSSMNTTTTTAITAAPTPQSLQGIVPATVTDPRTNRTWTLSSGMLLTFEPNTPNEETVMTTSSGGQIVATFSKNHPAMPGGSYKILSRGNPGPWLQYNPLQDSSVVLYSAILQ